MLLCENRPITSAVFIVLVETKKCIPGQLLLIYFSFVLLWPDFHVLIFFFVSNPKSDDHVMLGLNLNYVKLNFNNPKKKKKSKSHGDIYINIL